MSDLLQYNQIGFNHVGDRSCAAITDYANADLGWYWHEGKTIQLFGKTRFVKNYNITDDGITGTEVSIDDTPFPSYTSYNQTADGGTDPAPIEHTITSSENPDDGKTYRLALYCEQVTHSSVPGHSGTNLQFRWYCVEDERFNAPSINGRSALTYEFIQNGICGLSPGAAPSYFNIGLSTYFENFILEQANLWVMGYSDDYVGLLELSTNIPVFDTRAHCEAHLQDPSVIEGLLNKSQVTPEEEYEKQFQFWYIKNKCGHNTRNVSGPTVMSNYRFFPKRKGIAFVKHTPTSSEPYDRELVHYNGYDWKFAPWGVDDDDEFVDSPGGRTTFLSRSISFGANDYYTSFDYETNIPLWNTRQDADDYFAGRKDISEADNYAYISRQDDSILNPDLPGTDIDEETTLGTNGMRYSYGNRLYEIDNVELATLMVELFTPANVQDIIDGNKLFGSDTMQAVSGVMYLPLSDLSDVCEVGSLANIKIGAWESQNAQGKRIISNDKTIDCGSFFFNRIYRDFRDYEPYQLLFCNLPFCGCHQLTISKYLDKEVNISYNFDVTTGAVVCKLTGDGILLDIFEGTAGASRPISATDNNAYINSIVSAITGASASASGSIEGITNAVGGAGEAVATSSALGAVASGAGISLAAGGAAVGGIYKGYQIKNAVDNPPQMHRGSLASNLSYNLNTKPTFLFFTKRTVRPENELAVIGYPSGQGGKIRNFSGFLKCSAVKLANFPGTQQEYNDLINILSQGIYL